MLLHRLQERVGQSSACERVLDQVVQVVTAAVYFDDMYVPRELSLPTAEAIHGLRAWVTSEYEHDGLRVSNGAVLDRLIGLAQGLA